MNNAVMYDYYSYGSSSSDNEDNKEEQQNEQDAKLKKLMKEKGINIDESGDELDKKPTDSKSEEEDIGSEIDQVPELAFEGPKAKQLMEAA